MAELDRSIVHGLLLGLELHRLTNRSEQVLTNTAELLDELAGYRILPDLLAERLETFREDVRIALEEKNRK